MEDKITKRMTLTKLNTLRLIPLTAPLISDLKIVRNDNVGTMAISFKEKRIYFNKAFVESLNNKQLITAFAHEVFHYILYHDASALKNKSYVAIMNLATDSIINYILLNRLKFEKIKGLVTFDTIRKLSKNLANKTDEELIEMSHIEIARELIRDLQEFMKELENLISAYSQCQCDNSNQRGSGSGSNQNQENGKGKGEGEKDEKEKGEKEGDGTGKGQEKDKGGKSGKGVNSEEFDRDLKDLVNKHFGHLDEEEREAIKESIKEALRRQEREGTLSKEERKDLRNRIERGMILQKESEKNRGTEHGGISEILDIILRKKQRNWRKLLRETFSEIRTIMKDYDFTRPSRKVEIIKQAFNIDTFIPSIKKEGHEVFVIIGIDTSGSISNREYKEFINEIYTLMQDVKVKGWVVMWEAEVTKVIEIKNGWDKRVFEALRERKGYGGTVIKSFFDKAEELVKNRKARTYLIILTDGYTEDVEKEWIKGWKKVIFITQSKEALRKIEKERNVEIAYYELD